MTRLKLLLVLILVAAVGVVAYVIVYRENQSAQHQTATTDQPSKQSSAPSEAPKTPAVFDKKQLSNDDPASLWVIVDKLRPLNPKEYAPKVATPNMKLRLAATDPEMKVSTAMQSDLEALAAAAKTANLPLMLASGYRSYAAQVKVYNKEVATYGQVTADSESARPGFSEHQTGLAVDLAPAGGTCVVADCFAATAEGKWLAAHAYEFGFVVRYQEGKEATTGYRYEPWHVRYVGKPLATELNKLGNPLLEDFFGLPAAPDYAHV